MASLRILASAGVVAAGLLLSGQKYSSCQEYYRVDLGINAGHHQIDAEVARTPGARERGLGGRSCIGPDQGMLFVFKRPATYSFWMKDMRFSIDMIWINARHKVVKVQSDVSPASFPRIFKNEAPAKYVLEIGAGRAAEIGIHDGSSLQFTNL